MAGQRHSSHSSHSFAFIRVQLTCLCAKAWEMKTGSWSHRQTCRSLASWQCAGVAPAFHCTGGMEGYTVFSKDRWRSWGGVTPYVSDQLEWVELCPGMDEELSNRWWIRIKGGQGQVTLLWRFATGHHTRIDEFLYRHIDSCDHKPWFSLGISTLCHPNQNHRQLSKVIALSLCV